jgi:hypothetical protein
MFNLLHVNPTLAGKWSMQMKLFNRMNWLIEGMNSKIQPVFINDVALLGRYPSDFGSSKNTGADWLHYYFSY